MNEAKESRINYERKRERKIKGQDIYRKKQTNQGSEDSSTVSLCPFISKL
jgi:hypothetical protein